MRPPLPNPALLGIVLLTLAPPARAQTPPIRGIVIDEALTSSSALPAGLPDGLPITVRLSVDPGALATTGTGSRDGLDARLATYGDRHVPVIVALGRFPDAPAAADAWLRAVGDLAARFKGRVAGYQIGEVGGAEPAADVYTLMLQRTAVQLRSIDSSARIIQGAIPATAQAWLSRVYALNSAPYVDAVAVVLSATTAATSTLTESGAMADLIKRSDPGAAVIAGSVAIADPVTAAETFTAALLRVMGTNSDALAFDATPPSLAAALTAATRIADLLSGPAVSLDTAVRFTRAGDDVTAQVPYHLVFSLSRNSTYLIYEATQDAGTIEITTAVSMSTPAVRDPVSGAIDRLSATRIDTTSSRLVARQATHPLILDFNFGAAPLSASVDTAEVVLPPVEEIIARHQQARAAEDAALHTYIAQSHVTLTFHLSAADPAHHVLTDNELFVGPDGTEWVQRRFSMDGATWTRDPPAFPLLQAEKVLSLPLDLRLSQDYRYTLDGVETIDGRDAFVVSFVPIDTGRSLYRGRIWIDRQSFVRLKVSATETHLEGSITASEEDQSFARVGEVDHIAIWLPVEQTIRQSLLLAGKTVLLERRVQLSDIELNPATFTARQSAARESDEVMYRDTDKGLRNFVKRNGVRVTSEQATRSVRALALGADFDPSLDGPLPIAGLEMVDFDFLHKGLQFSLLFGGVVGYGNIERAALAGGRLDLGVDFYGVALNSTDKVFSTMGEIDDQRVLTRPFVVGVNAGVHATASHKITARYEYRYDSFARAPATRASFATPASGSTSGIGGGYEYIHRGYVATAHALTYWRHGWTSWGADSPAGSANRRYSLYDAGFSKDVVLSPLQTLHFNAQYFGGTHLDRFNMYQFGVLDPARMHGVPWTLRFENLGMVRTSYAFDAFGLYRLEIFGEGATGRDRRIDTRWRPLAGLGVALNFRGPRGTLVKIDAGQSVLPAMYRAAGSHVVQVLVLKPF